jgi:hypothetical protein
MFARSGTISDDFFAGRDFLVSRFDASIGILIAPLMCPADSWLRRACPQNGVSGVEILFRVREHDARRFVGVVRARRFLRAAFVVVAFADSTLTGVRRPDTPANLRRESQC